MLLRDGDRYGDFQSPAFRAAFAFYLDLFRRGLAPAAAKAQVANLYQDFAAGYFAFYISGPWNIGEFARRLPADAGRRAGRPRRCPRPSAGAPGRLDRRRRQPGREPQRAPRQEAAWQLIEFLSEPASRSSSIA